MDLSGYRGRSLILVCGICRTCQDPAEGQRKQEPGLKSHQGHPQSTFKRSPGLNVRAHNYAETTQPRWRPWEVEPALLLGVSREVVLTCRVALQCPYTLGLLRHGKVNLAQQSIRIVTVAHEGTTCAICVSDLKDDQVVKRLCYATLTTACGETNVALNEACWRKRELSCKLGHPCAYLQLARTGPAAVDCASHAAKGKLSTGVSAMFRQT